jgi:UPF0176 protein
MVFYSMPSLMNYKIAALYHFVAIADAPAMQEQLRQELAELDLCGTLLVAPEGINGTLAGSPPAIDALIQRLHQLFALPYDAVKYSEAEEKPFKRLKVRLKKEIITFKQAAADPTKICGTYVEAKDWNHLLADPDVTVLDTRNRYETMIGTFMGAADPAIETFTEFADYVREHLDPAKHKKIAMYCTGGIRCEKASAFMKAEGFEEVYHLKGGILKYLETIPADQSRWQGDCYVFDRRMAVGHGLKPAAYAMCFSCGLPLTAEDKQHPHYEEGVACHHCYAKTSAADKDRFRMRHRYLIQEDSMEEDTTP